MGLCTVDVANVVVQVDLRVIPLSIHALKTGTKHVAVVNTDVFSGVVERHVEVVGVVFLRIQKY